MFVCNWSFPLYDQIKELSALRQMKDADSGTHQRPPTVKEHQDLDILWKFKET